MEGLVPVLKHSDIKFQCTHSVALIMSMNGTWYDSVFLFQTCLLCCAQKGPSRFLFRQLKKEMNPFSRP